MKAPAAELPLGKPLPTRRIKIPKFAPVLITFTLLFTFVHLYCPSLRYDFNSKKISEPTTSSFHSLPDSTTAAADSPPVDPDPDLGFNIQQNYDQPQQQPQEEESELRQTPEIEATGILNSVKNSDQTTKSGNSHGQEQQQQQQQGQQRTGSRKKKGRRERRHNSPSGTGIHRERREKVARRFPNLSGVTVDQNKEVIPVVDSAELIDKDEGCDLFSGEWVPNPEGPYYTNETCWAIQEHQNCMKFGRPDAGFLKWRWKPDGCELPIFEANQFLELVSGKSIAFVGDSVARNHMQSLICLLSKVVYPIDVLRSSAHSQNQRWLYKDYNFNVSMFWAPYLVRSEKTDANDVTRPFSLYLDEFDEDWTSNVGSYDYIIISAGHWFFRPTMFYVGGRLAGCLYCQQENVTHLTSSFSYRRAFRTALRAINSLDNFTGVTFLRTFAPSHFEGGPWDKGGDCARTRPFRRDEKALSDYNLEMYNIQLQELAIAQKDGRRKGMTFKLFDATKPMLLRPDGHPSKYGHWQNQNVSMANDCVHWCLPGPIDAWNDFLFELLRREYAADRSFGLNFIHS